ncbi:uncharacterized protein DUF4328 [Actinomadura pelletieri DSM 43383]|uniref:Uncharacterized protein DUF4328 n=1 Tax=Actinomadura pelletieri DSM 43383 TaxID=1120940 RepID=A0A495QRL7_9ACTN|nr:DUF4328 domain-containing protein [Actinomadura pelletieri]RKS76140.1 uncharacterized protein DUF4328 [Actinomadura pelletieri DSM 43383]
MVTSPQSPDLVHPPSGASVPALIGLGANAVMLNIVTVVGVWTVYVVDDGTDEARNAGDLLAFGTFVAALLVVATGVAVIAWLWRARANAEIIDDLSASWSSPWVILGWIVPIMNLWVPRGVVGAVWRVSAPHRESPWPVNLWWTAFLAYLIGGRFASTNPADGFRSDIYPFVTFTGALAALFAMMVVWRITRFQEAQAVRLREALAPGH